MIAPIVGRWMWRPAIGDSKSRSNPRIRSTATLIPIERCRDEVAGFADILIFRDLAIPGESPVRAGRPKCRK